MSLYTYGLFQYQENLKCCTLATNSKPKAMPRIKRKEDPKPSITIETTDTDTGVTMPTLSRNSRSSSESSASVALPIPSRSSTPPPPVHSTALEDEEAVPDESAFEPSPHDAYMEERRDYIQYLIEEADEDMLERMYRYLSDQHNYYSEELNTIRSALAEINRQVILMAQHDWAQDRADELAAEEEAAAETERRAKELEELRIREQELAELEKLQAKYKRPNPMLQMFSYIIMSTTVVTAALIPFLK